MYQRNVSIVINFIVTLAVSGCLLETETAIKPDPKVDPRLEGVWRITEKLPSEIRSDRDRDEIGVHGYIIIAPMTDHDDTYKALAFDSFEPDRPSKFPEMFVSTRKHKGHNLMLVRLADHEKKDAKKGELTFKNWVVDYEFNKSGELFLRFLFLDDFDKIQKVHAMEFDQIKQPFAPVAIKGNEEKLLDFYSDPKVRALLTAMGKYQKLEPKKK